jgi:hypothetical protein
VRRRFFIQHFLHTHIKPAAQEVPIY